MQLKIVFFRHVVKTLEEVLTKILLQEKTCHFIFVEHPLCAQLGFEASFSQVVKGEMDRKKND